ncbi:hypothetical protein WMF30_41430 [Sorangium sp. So ce134]
MAIEISDLKADGSSQSFHVRGTINGVELDHDLVLDMDGNHAEWIGDAEPIEIGSDHWHELMMEINKDPRIVEMVIAYNEG